MRVIITRASGMVGEGVLLECLNNINITNVLMINRKYVSIEHAKLQELIVNDFTQIPSYKTI